MRESLDARRGSSAIDPDEFFQKEREWAAEYGSQLRDVCDRFQSMLNSQLRLANQGRLRCVRFMQHVKNLPSFHFRYKMLLKQPPSLCK